MSDDALTLDRVRAAAARLDGVAHRTPLLSSTLLDERSGAAVLLKAEPFQRSGSFKFRGAYNRLSLLDPAAKAAGVVAFSSGNHGAAVALAAKLLGVAAVIVVPANGSAAKLAAIEGYGARAAALRPADREPRGGRGADRCRAVDDAGAAVRRLRRHGRSGHCRPRASRPGTRPRPGAAAGRWRRPRGGRFHRRQGAAAARVGGRRRARRPRATPASPCAPGTGSASPSPRRSPTACGPGSRAS